ncbi:MAG: Bacterial alpha-L-rhamnosidase [bacterium]|nr:Bacterial alpha-L-rhamnosidase [bacterium]
MLCTIGLFVQAQPGAITITPDLQAYHLRCEYLDNPLGIDSTAPRLSWKLRSNDRGQRQSAYQILAASTKENLMRDRGDLWDSGRVDSAETVNIVYQGAPLHSRQQVFWKVRSWNQDGQPSVWSETASWSMGLLEPGDWQADWISIKDDSPFTANRESLTLPPARYFRREFNARPRVTRATLYATALGVYEARLNGKPVSDQRFTPGWSDYRERVYYNTFDVTRMIEPGENALGAVLADGWYSGYLGYGFLNGMGPNHSGRCFYGKTPALRMQLEIEYDNGQRETIVTNPEWKTGQSPFVEADTLMGETYDARLEQPGWDHAGFDDSSWDGCVLSSSNGSTKAVFYDADGEHEVELGFVEPKTMQAYGSVPIHPIEEISPISVTEPEPGVFLFNMGQNFSGVVRLRVKGAAGDKIVLRYGEMLHPDGGIMTENLRKARATDTYILRGDPAGETYTPTFTYHGFQYVEIRGLKEKPAEDTITGVVIHSDTPLTSTFECSDPLVNRLYKNVVWTQRSNFFEIPTDCPQRDERFGWMGDAQVYARTATYNADAAAFYTKWLDDLEEAQLANGAYPDYSPYPMMVGKPHAGFGAAWMDAGIICPYAVYKAYGDLRVIERHYDSMTRFMDFREKSSPDGLGVNIGNTWGDWLAIGEETPIEYIDTVYYAYDAKLMKEMAKAIGRDDDSLHYAEIFSKIQKAFQGKYLKGDGELTVATQSAYALALWAGLIPNDQADAAVNRLATRIENNGGRMATGFLGTRPLLPVLTEYGKHDLALRLFQSTEYPSWLYEVVNGATTIWERWNSYTKEEGFASVTMNSFSHYAFGAVCEWMFDTLAGIDQAAPSFARIRIDPRPPKPGATGERPPFQWVKASYDSIRGPIRSEWKQEGGVFTLKVEIPANTGAEVILPTRDVDSIMESGSPVENKPNIILSGQDESGMTLQVGSGVYEFTMTR